jgi:sortase A
VPIGVVLLTIGFILTGTAVAVWLLIPLTAPYVLPELIPLAAVPTLTPTPASSADAPLLEDEPLILLPETPLDAIPLRFDLPSEASAGAAPTALFARQPGQPLRLIIPSLSVNAPIYEVGLEKAGQGDEIYYQWAVPAAYAAGWHGDSALLGQPGNTVLNGHHNIYGQIFRNLMDVEVGAEMVLEDLQGSYQYRIVEKQILAEQGQPLTVRAANARWIEPTEDERVTIVTCWPMTGNSHRLIVVAVPAQ